MFLHRCVPHHICGQAGLRRYLATRMRTFTARDEPCTLMDIIVLLLFLVLVFRRRGVLHSWHAGWKQFRWNHQ